MSKSMKSSPLLALTLTTGTGNYEPLIFDSEEDLIMEEPSGSCDQNRIIR